MASDALTGFLLPSSLCPGTEGVWVHDTCGAVQKRPWRASSSLWGYWSFSCLCAFTDSTWRPWDYGRGHPCQCRGPEQSVAALAGFVSHPGASLNLPLLTKDLPALTQRLAGCSLLGLSVAQSPTTPTAGGEPTRSFISPHHGHPAVGCDKGWGVQTPAQLLGSFLWGPDTSPHCWIWS